MIKRKNGVKSIIGMVVVIVMLIITNLPVWTTSPLNEVDVLDNFVVQLNNPHTKAYNVTVKIVYQDKNGNIIHEEEVTNEVDSFETMTIDAKNLYNSKKTQKISAEIIDEVEAKMVTLYAFLVMLHTILISVSIMLLILSALCLLASFTSGDEDIDNCIFVPLAFVITAIAFLLRFIFSLS